MRFVVLASAASAAFAGVSAVMIPGGYDHAARHVEPVADVEGYSEASMTSLGTRSPASASSEADFAGVATFFFQGGLAGACGKIHQDSDFIAALQPTLYGSLNAVSPNCGRKIGLTNTNNGKTVTVTVADVCPTCQHADDLDLSEAAFLAIAPSLSVGEVPITWSFLD